MIHQIQPLSRGRPFTFPIQSSRGNFIVFNWLALACFAEPDFSSFNRRTPMDDLSQTTVNWASLLEEMSQLSTSVIVVLFSLHVGLFFVLWVWSKRDFRVIASSLFDFTKGLKNQSLLDSNSHLGDQIEVFLADVTDVLDDPNRAADRHALLTRMQFLDEKRSYLQSMSFETVYNSARTMIEAYPLAGVLGTMLAIGAALNTKTDGQAATVAQVVERFGEAIWCSFAGLISAIILMFINSWLEPSFNRLTEDRKLVRETIGRAKRELTMSTAKVGESVE